MELPVNPKHIVIAVIIVVVAYFVLNSLPQPQAVSAKFDAKQVLAGQKSVLTLSFTNVFDRDFSNVVLCVRAIDAVNVFVDPDATVLKDSCASIAIVEKGNVKEFPGIPVFVNTNATKGTYSLEITAQFDGKSEKQRISLEVLR